MKTRPPYPTSYELEMIVDVFRDARSEIKAYNFNECLAALNAGIDRIEKWQGRYGFTYEPFGGEQ